MTETAGRRGVGPRSRKIFAEESRHMAPGLQSFALYSGLAMARGIGSRLYDEDGNAYIDFIAGIAVGSVGHCHPHYVARLKEQLERLTFGSFTTEVRSAFLQLLASVAPPGLTRIQLFSGGSEAVEAAFRLAKSATKKHEFVGYTGAFHGKTGGVLPLLWGDFKAGLGPFAPGCYSAPYAYCYRCPLSLTYPDCGIACAEMTRDVIRNQTGGAIAAVIVEPMQGTAGNVIPPPGFLPAIQSIARENGALLIADEMITGFGRTGKMWGVDHDGVVPDILTVGKGVGGGFPLSGILSTDALTSYPSLEIITRENLVENSERVGRAMLGRLLAMQEKHPVIGDVRGKGLLLGLELVKDRATKELVSKDQTKALFQECLRRGLVAMSYSPVIRINPPLNIDEATALEGLDILDEALTAVFPSPPPSGSGGAREDSPRRTSAPAVAEGHVPRSGGRQG